ncbi:MAG: phosphatase PAP2 family protein [Dysgonamonadaceae bacterium]|jgi:undecaprenyl-diphosphatase|nr:phosphatase PAP2 family protein [Dysgonamonadaceae bacterium]
MLEHELTFEKDLFFFLQGSESVFWDHFLWLYSYKWIWLPFYACFLFVFIYRRNWKEIIITFLAVALVVTLCDQISSGFFKPVFRRFRPGYHPAFQEHLDLVLGYRGGGQYGFISSHAANAFGFATFTALLFRNKLFTGTLIIFALVNGYSRIYLGVHFISDVVVGSAIGILIGYVVYELTNQARFYVLKIGKPELKQAVYPAKQAYFICLSYLIFIILMMLFNNRLIDYFHK